jgi:hypothetical protein
MVGMRLDYWFYSYFTGLSHHPSASSGTIGHQESRTSRHCTFMREARSKVGNRESSSSNEIVYIVVGVVETGTLVLYYCPSKFFLPLTTWLPDQNQSYVIPQSLTDYYVPHRWTNDHVKATLTSSSRASEGANQTTNNIHTFKYRGLNRLV